MTSYTATATAILAFAAAATSAAADGHLKKVVFGTNWLAQAEHGGFYQSVADGTYAACGLDVEIVSGGPQVNNRALLLAGRIDYHMGGDMLSEAASFCLLTSVSNPVTQPAVADTTVILVTTTSHRKH